MNRRAYRRQWNRLKDKYERRGFRIMRKAIRETALQIPFDKLTLNTYAGYVTFYITQDKIKQGLTETYQTIANAHGRRVGASVNNDIDGQKNFTLTGFQQLLIEFIQQFFVSQAATTKITTIQKGLAEYLISYISDSFARGLTTDQVVRELSQHIRSRNFYRWQIERIVRTETTAAANQGAILAAKDADFVMDKVWISSNDSRTRRRPDDQFDHMTIDGQRVGEDEPFNVQGDLIMFPGDPGGNPSNTINCRCAVAMAPRRGPDGRLIRR